VQSFSFGRRKVDAALQIVDSATAGETPRNQKIRYERVENS